MYFFLGRVRTKFFCTVKCTLNAPYNEVKTPVFLYKSSVPYHYFWLAQTKFFCVIQGTPKPMSDCPGKVEI